MTAGTVPRHEMEIIEIGAVLVAPGSYTALNEFPTFRAVRDLNLTEFCTSMTTIKQLGVDAAPVFAKAFSASLVWFESCGSPVLGSWGAYDLN